MTTPTQRQTFERLAARARAAHARAVEVSRGLRPAHGQSPVAFAFATLLNHWAVVENLSGLLDALPSDAPRTPDTDTLLDALRVSTEGLEETAAFLHQLSTEVHGER